MSIIETIRQAEKEAAGIKREAVQAAREKLREAEAAAEENRNNRARKAREDAEQKLLVADELASSEARNLMKMRAQEHKDIEDAARSKLPQAKKEILGRIVKAV